MKLSEMNIDQLSDAMVMIAGPVERIASDPDAEKALESLSGDGTMSKFGAMVGRFVPLLLKTHRDDVLTILSAMTGKDVGTLRAQNGMQTIREARECVDKDLIDFFGSFASTDTRK